MAHRPPLVIAAQVIRYSYRLCEPVEALCGGVQAGLGTNRNPSELTDTASGYNIACSKGKLGGWGERFDTVVMVNVEFLPDNPYLRKIRPYLRKISFIFISYFLKESATS